MDNTHATVLDLGLFRAKQLIEDGKFHISTGDFDRAVETFQKSVESSPTPEAYTYIGWVLSLKGQFDEAIDLCFRALELDPDFGNALNDLGSYYIQKDELEQAIPWLEKAKRAEGYDSRHFPFINMGRIYSMQGKIGEAIEEFKQALTFVPGHLEIEKVLQQLQKLKNSAN